MDNDLAYICSPYSGNIAANTEAARRYSRAVMERGYIPIAPHLLFPQFVSEETERNTALRLCRRLLAHCGSIWICGERITPGMAQEIAVAQVMGIRKEYLP